VDIRPDTGLVRSVFGVDQAGAFEVALGVEVGLAVVEVAVRFGAEASAASSRWACSAVSGWR
jgi:hypothetical protein